MHSYFLKEWKKKELLSTWVSRGLESLMVKMQLSGDRRARMKDGEMQEPFLALPEAAELQKGALPSVEMLQEVPLWLR